MKITTNNVIENRAIGIFNYVKVIYIPVGVKVFISFTQYPKDGELFPLNDLIKDLDSQERYKTDVREVFITTTGTSDTEIELTCINVYDDDGLVDISMSKETILQDEISTALIDKTVIQEDEVKNAILDKTVIQEIEVKNAILDIANIHKDIKPYNFPLFYAGTHSGDTVTTILNKTLVCDKIKIDLSCYSNVPYTYDYNIRVLIDNIVVCSLSNGKGFSAYRNNSFPCVVLESIKYKNIKILASSQTTSGTGVSYTLQEYSKKV